MNYWQDETNRNNWTGATRKYENLQQQEDEVVGDLLYFIPDILVANHLLSPRNNMPSVSFLDVGGGDGRIGEALKKEAKNCPQPEIMYKNIDFQTGIDITQDWTKQGVPEKFDVVFSSLTLICLPEVELNAVVKQIYDRATKAIYLFEEQSISKLGCGVVTGSDKGYKYNHLWSKHFWPIAERRDSVVKPKNWERLFIVIGK